MDINKILIPESESYRENKEKNILLDIMIMM